MSCCLPEHKATPEMKKFFEKLLKLKSEIKQKADKDKDPFIMEIYQKLDSIIKEDK